MNRKPKIVLALLASLPLFVGCAKQTNSLAGTSKTNNSSSADESSSPNSLTIKNYKPCQEGNITSMPVFISNNGENNTSIDSNSFTLRVGKAKYKYYSPASGANDFHYSLQSGNQFNSLVTFKTGSLSKKQLANARIYYQTTNGKDEKSSLVSANTNWQSLTQNSMISNHLDLGDYYQKAKQYLADKSNTQNPTDLKENFDDPNYNKLTGTLVANGKSASTEVAVLFNNNTNTDMNLSLRSVELENNNHTDILVSPVWQNFNLNLPANKTSIAVIPFQQSIDSTAVPYQVKIQSGGNSDSDSNNTFTNTSQGFHPLNLVFAPIKNNSDLFELTPDQIAHLDSIAAKYDFQNDRVNFVCDNKSDFTVSSMITSFYLESGKDKLYATADGNSAINQQIEPNNKQTIILKFNDLQKFLAAHKKVNLKYLSTVVSKH